MKVSQTMTPDVRIARPDQTIREAAQMMRDIDAGALPVGENDRLVGFITDRDIAVRAVGAGKSPDTLVRDVMTKEICYCHDDDDIGTVAGNMANVKVRRLPVIDRNKRLVGIVSIADIALADGTGQVTAEAVCGVSEPGGLHSHAGGRRLA